jgi:hypothetical protein
MTVSAVVERRATGKREAQHVVSLETEVFDDPVRLTVVLNHELWHLASEEKAVRDGTLEARPYASEEFETYKEVDRQQRAQEP